MSRVNWNKIDVGYNAQYMQLNSYLSHCKSVTNIKKKPSPLTKSIETQKFNDLMKKHRGIANTYIAKNYDDRIKKENKHLLGNIQEICYGNYSSKIPKRTLSQAGHKFKSLRSEEMRNMQDRIQLENSYNRSKIMKVGSNLSKESLLHKSDLSLKHGEHQSKYGKNRRHFDTLPKIFRKPAGMESTMREFGEDEMDGTKSIISKNQTTTKFMKNNNSADEEDNVLHSHDFSREQDTKFYEKGSIIVVATHLKGKLESEKCQKIVFMKGNEDEIATYEFLLENRKNFKNNIKKDLIEGLEDIKADIFIIENSEEDPKKIGGISFNIQEASESSNDKYNEIIKSELTHAGIKYGVTILKV